MIWSVEQALWCLVLGLILLAGLWETQHLLDWMMDLQTNDAARLLREHAYEYARWFFGTDFGWTR